ncbi:MAG TPA: cation:proton antiporter [Casimicrobiaceae bacterium]|jgi:Kef-type K+ transport system membrane component KefB|nr:cation:proton antiporter [Casimicrobiaceae bacterium]
MPQHVDLLGSVGIAISVAAILAFIGQRLRQPLLLAYLLAGVLIGPRIGLGIVSDEESIQTVSEIGLILLLFIIGLELDLKKLLSAGKPVLVTGVLQFPLCAALGLAFFAPFGFSMRGSDFSLLYLAVCLALSSTMIVVKLLYDKFELDTLPGRITLGVLIFQDVWAIVVLGVQPNLRNPELGKVLLSLGSGVLLVGATLLISKTLLPRVFRSVAKLPELVLIGSLAWCFIVCAAASGVGLSREMGALIAGISISTFPYNMDVIAKVVSIRDFFVTLFFVALGMQIPMPSVGIVALAIVASLFLVASRFVVVFPILRALRQGHRTSLLPSINLAQMSEFSMVIAAIGLTYGHIDSKTATLLIFVFAITSVASTYLIGYSHPLQATLASWLSKVSLKDLDASQPAETGEADGVQKDVVLLGFFTDASALVHEYEMGETPNAQAMLERLLVIDFNPEVHAELSRRGIACRYGDVANMDTLHHAGVHAPRLVVSTIPDAILKGTSNARLLRLVRRLWPEAKAIVTASGPTSAIQLYEAGADFVFVSRLHSASQMASILERALDDDFAAVREAHVAQIRRRREVLA